MMNLNQFRVEIKDDAGQWQTLEYFPTLPMAIHKMNDLPQPARVVNTDTGTTFTKPE